MLVCAFCDDLWIMQFARRVVVVFAQAPFVVAPDRVAFHAVDSGGVVLGGVVLLVGDGLRQEGLSYA